MAKIINGVNFQAEVINSKSLVLLDFYSDNCLPCLVVSPILEDLEKEYGGKLKLVKINADDNMALAEKYNLMSIPTLIFSYKGDELGRITGLAPKSSIRLKIDALLKNIFI